MMISFLFFLIKFIIDYNMCYRFYFSFFFIVCFVFSEDWLFKIKDSYYAEAEMYSFYGMGEWVRSSKEKKQKMVADFIIRESAYFAALDKGFDSSPSFYEKTFNRSRQLLVNYVYQMEIGRLATDSSRLALGKKFLKQDRLVHHILIGYAGSSLRVPIEKTKEDAFSFSLGLLDSLSFDSFKEASLSFSDDGAAKRNGGRLGWLSWGSTIPSFEEFVFSSPLKKVVGPVETEFGYHLVYIEDSRPSSFSFLSEGEYLDHVLLRSSSRDVGVLKTFSSHYDSLVLDKGGVVFNDSLITFLFSSFSPSLKKNKGNIVSLLQKNSQEGVLCVYNKRGFGLPWFASQLEGYSPSNRPTVTTIESFYKLLKTVLLQKAAYDFGVAMKYDKKELYLKGLLSYKKDLLYSLYFKNLVNSVQSPDSLRIKEFYELHKGKKYKTLKSLKLKEIRVESWSLADRLLGLYIEGASFADLCKDFSLGWSEKTQGEIGPVEASFEGGKISSYFEGSFIKGDVGNIVENKDGSFSFFFIVRVFPEGFIPFDKVYSRASSLLYRQDQEKTKKDKISSFYKKYNIVVNDSLF